jgi:hypothetical protein
VKALPLIGWQTLLADLSLILFMVTAAAMATSPTSQRNAPKSVQPVTDSLSEPVAWWRAGGSQPLAAWLAAQQPDPRQQLTITLSYSTGGLPHALAAAQTLVSAAGRLGKVARVIVEPAPGADGEETLATLAYDRPRVRGPAASTTNLAYGLQGGAVPPLVRNLP